MAVTSNTDKINKAYKFFYRDGLKNSFLYFPLKKIHLRSIFAFEIEDEKKQITDSTFHFILFF
jgi:hypothetical protein